MIYLLQSVNNPTSNPNREIILQNLLDQAKETIEAQGHVINSYGAYLNYIAFILTAMAIVIPLVTYLFGIKPSKDAISDLQENIDNKIRNYIDQSTENLINESIENLKNNDILKKKIALKYIEKNNQYLKDKHLFELYDLASNANSSQDLLPLCIFIGWKPNRYADKLFSDKSILSNPEIFKQAVYYSTLVGLDKFDKIFGEIIHQKGHMFYVSLYQNINNENLDLLKIVFNSSTIIDNIEDYDFLEINNI